MASSEQLHQNISSHKALPNHLDESTRGPHAEWRLRKAQREVLISSGKIEVHAATTEHACV